MPHYKTIIELLKDTLYAWQQDKGSRLAAALAYYTVFSITPLLIIIISITGLVFGERAAHDEIANQLTGLVGLEAAEMVQTMLANFKNPTSGILTSLLGLVTMFYGATGLFYHVQGALNTIWHCENTEGNGFVHQVKQRFIHLAIIFGVGAFLLVILFAELAFTAITQYLNLDSLPQTSSFFIYVLMVTLLFAVLYKILPEVDTAWRDVILGAAVTSILFNVGRLLIGVYMRLSNIGSAYGTAGSLVVLLVWVYYSAQIFLLGAEFTHVYAHTWGSHKVSISQQSEAPLPEDDINRKTDVHAQPPPNTSSGLIQYDTVGDASETPRNHQARTDDTAPVTLSQSEKTKTFSLSKKTVTISTIIGTLTASILSLTWLHRQRKRKKVVKND